MMRKRLQIVGAFMAIAGLGFGVAAVVAYAKVQDGYGALQSFSEAQNVTLTYNEDGQLLDRGETEPAEAIMSLLKDDWNYPVVESDLDPNNPLVNTATEYMYQMAVVSYHVMNGTQTVVLEDDVTTESGEVFTAGEYEFDVDGRYWTDFDRSNPIEAVAREQAWTGTAHGLIGELGVGTVTHSALQLGLALAGLFAGLGLVLIASGAGLVWAGRGKDMVIPDTVPEAFTTERIEEPTLDKV